MRAVDAAPSQRILSVDVLRGLTIAFMILVNDPGDWGHVYPQLDHAAWNGFTCTDLVFPNFLFLVGMSIVFSLQSRILRLDGKSGKVAIAGHIVRRAAVLFAIKMFLSGFPHFHYAHVRLYGVLTRIALCYLAAGLIFFTTQRARTLVGIAVGLLLGYWVLMRYVPVPGYGVPTRGMPILDQDGNLAAWLDRVVSGLTLRTINMGKLYERTRDPEGLLSTLPAVATTLIGCVAGLWVRRVETRRAFESAGGISRLHCLNGLIVSGALLLAGGTVWNLWFPINKNLWTSSYVLWSAGWSLLLLGSCYLLIDIYRGNASRLGGWLAKPWLVFGSNAIFAFVFSNFMVELMLWIKVPGGALVNATDPSKPITAWLWVYRHGFARSYSNEHTSLAFAIAFVVFCYAPCWLLYRKRVFLKV